MRRVIRLVQDQRDERYDLLRGYFHGADDDTADEQDQERLSTITLPVGARASGKKLSYFTMEKMGARVVSLRRTNGQSASLAEDPELQGGDTLVLSGKPESLAVAEEKLMRA